MWKITRKSVIIQYTHSFELVACVALCVGKHMNKFHFAAHKTESVWLMVFFLNKRQQRQQLQQHQNCKNNNRTISKSSLVF